MQTSMTMNKTQMDNIMKRFFEMYPEVKELKLSDFNIEDGIIFPKNDSYLYEYLHGDITELISLAIGKKRRTDIVPYLTNLKTMSHMTAVIMYGAYGMTLFIQPWLKDYFKKKGDIT